MSFIKSIPNGIRKFICFIFNPVIRVYQNISIRYKLLLVLNILIIIPLAGLGYMNYRNSEETLMRKSTQYTQDILNMIEIRLSDYVRNLDIISQDLLPDDRVALSIDLYTMPADPLQVYEEAFAMENLFKKMLITRQEIQSIALISHQGNYHPADLNNTNISIKQLVPYRSELYEKIAAEARKKSGSPVFYLELENGRVKHLFLARTVYNVSTYEEIGIMLFLLRTDYLNTIFSDLINEDMQNIMILSANNEIIADKDQAQSIDIQQRLSGMAGSSGWFMDETKTNIISYSAMDQKPHWKVVSLVSLANLYKDIDSLRQKIVYSSIGIVILLTIISLLMTSDFIRPFKKLISGMERVQKGDKNVSIALKRKDEIGYLGEAFNRMVREMHTLSDWVYQEQLTRKEAELKALQSQINPHFLFNTLESINWMAQLNDVPEISHMVSALSSLMEASIGRDDKLITIRDELKYIDNYYLIMQKRFGDRMTLVKDIDADALEYSIPRLLIQPLIENAIHHGIENNQASGRITLSAQLSEDHLTIKVEDDGEGIDSEDLAIMNENLSMDNETYFKRIRTRTGKSIGLENVNRRIKLFYGERYGIAIESEKNHYTRVIVTIPLNQPESKLQGDVS